MAIQMGWSGEGQLFENLTAEIRKIVIKKNNWSFTLFLWYEKKYVPYQK